jgi:hypothetical protein
VQYNSSVQLIYIIRWGASNETPRHVKDVHDASSRKRTYSLLDVPNLGLDMQSTVKARVIATSLNVPSLPLSSC